ncbi:MAG: DUF1499 domain-containing protein [Alphaproteobacteria bacterium]|nr:DUF1499 domain-containing protein [Alphaproteobacteria bacterium]
MSVIYFIIIVSIAFWAYGRENTWKVFFGKADMGAVDFASLSPAKKTNNALFCPEDYCPKAERKSPSPIFDMSAETLKDKLFNIINAEPHMQQVGNDDANHDYRFVQYTRLMRFPDTIRIKIIDLGEDKSTLAIFSESQIGRNDFSVNYKRINGWMDILEGK